MRKPFAIAPSPCSNSGRRRHAGGAGETPRRPISRSPTAALRYSGDEPSGETMPVPVDWTQAPLTLLAYAGHTSTDLLPELSPM